LGHIPDLPDTIMLVDAVPHTWLFPRMAAVCHHGGAGTSAAGFAAGVPSVIVPFANDQFAWRQRAFDLGVGTMPIARTRLTVAALSAAFVQAAQPALRQAARTLAEQIATEQGAAQCAAVVAGI
jgi:sterol 3beta-glucosyltransferase